MERELPIYTIEGTGFLVDVSKQELKEKNNPANTISFLEMEDHGTHYTLRYDPDVKNLPEVFGKSVTEVNVPQMVQLDPEGMAAHHGLSLDEVKRKTDFDIVVNQDLVQLREKGVLPIIEIAGHPFYVDLRMDNLRPKDDFSTIGIQFSEIDYCLVKDESMYQFPYNTKSRTYEDIDVDAITAIPKNVIIVEIPYKSKLDPIGYSRKYGLDQKGILRAYPPEAEMKARSVPWKETPINEIIARNLEKAKKAKIDNSQKPSKRKGRRI